jgi:hypothetical protein
MRSSLPDTVRIINRRLQRAGLRLRRGSISSPPFAGRSQIIDCLCVLHMFSLGMMIRAEDEEIRITLEIAVGTAPQHLVRTLFSGHKMDVKIAEEALVQRVFAALRKYELMRPAHPAETARSVLPLFPD